MPKSSNGLQKEVLISPFKNILNAKPCIEKRIDRSFIKMPRSTKPRKPTVTAKCKNYTIPTTTRNIVKGVLNASASEWTSPSKLVSAMDVSIITTKSSEDIFTMLLKTFVNLSKTSSTTSIKNHAFNCYNYASQDKFKQEFIDIIESRKLKIGDLAIEKRIHELANQGMDGALDVASGSMTQVVSRALDVVNDNECTSIVTEEGNNTNENEEEEDDDDEHGSDADNERVWNEVNLTSQ